MTAPGDASDARWCTAVSAAVAEAAERAGRLARAVAEDWRDGHGQEWAERTALLHRELGRVAAEAAEIGAEIRTAIEAATNAAIARRAAEAPPTSGSAPVGPSLSWQEALAPLRAAAPGTATRAQGPRLGSLDGERTDHDLGMRIAELPEPG